MSTPAGHSPSVPMIHCVHCGRANPVTATLCFGCLKELAKPTGSPGQNWGVPDSAKVPDPPGYGVVRSLGFWGGVDRLDEMMVHAAQCPDANVEGLQRFLYRVKLGIVVIIALAIITGLSIPVFITP